MVTIGTEIRLYLSHMNLLNLDHHAFLICGEFFNIWLKESTDICQFLKYIFQTFGKKGKIKKDDLIKVAEAEKYIYIPNIIYIKSVSVLGNFYKIFYCLQKKYGKEIFLVVQCGRKGNVKPSCQEKI